MLDGDWSSDVCSSDLEYKARLLISLLPYVHWAGAADGSSASSVELVILGKSPFGTSLDGAARASGLGSRRVRVRYLDRFSEVGRCDALYLCEPDRPDLEMIRTWARANKVLTITEARPRVEPRVMVNLGMEGLRWPSRLYLAVDPTEAALGGIQFSPILLRQARITAPS
jgi:hypothetical protein